MPAGHAAHATGLPTGEDDPRVLGLHRTAPQRDVPYVPTDDAVVMAMLRFGHVGPEDVVYDLGCGDGRIVIAAARHCGARGVGVDIDPLRIREARENARRLGVGDRVTFLCQSFFDTPVHDATVMMLYLLPSINIKLRPKLLTELRTGTRIIANQFDMGDWPADIRAEVHHRTLLQWIIPAWVPGTWSCIINFPTGRRRMVLRLHRKYQAVLGTAQLGRTPVDVANGRMFGDQLTFKIADPLRRNVVLRFSARVDSGVMRGACQETYDGPPIAWCGFHTAPFTGAHS
jgi:SAM-dependent methyltransferase